MKFNRFSTAAIIILGICTLTAPLRAEDVPPMPGMPKTGNDAVVMPYVLSKINPPEERAVVRVFFLYSCQFCYASHQAIEQWGRTLPSGIRFELTPVVIRDVGAGLGAAFHLAARYAYPKQASMYDQAVYDEIHRNGGRADREETYLKAGRRLSMDTNVLSKTARSSKIQEGMLRSAQLLDTYGLQTTPSIVTGGRYIVTPEPTGGVNERFFQLLNAVTSKQLIDLKG